ncbi:MAG: glycosyltransferase family 39 protein [archaeon]
MEEKHDKSSERVKKIRRWFRNPYNVSFFGVILFAFLLRLYFFILTKSQPLWWDELAYGSLAKNMVHHLGDNTWVIISELMIRPTFFPFLWSLILRMGFGEIATRFLLEFIPSVLAVIGVYYVGKILYNKKVALLSAFIFSVLWIHLFYTCRLLSNVPALPLVFFSVYFFFKSLESKKFNARFFAISLILLSLSTLIRYPNGLIFFAYLAFLVITFRKDLLTNKKFYLAGVIGVCPLLFFFGYNFVVHGNIFPALLGNQYLESGSEQSKPFAFHLLKFIPGYLQTTFFLAFLVGLIVSLFELIIGYDIIKKRRKLKADILMLIILGFIYAFFIFYLRAAEDRWLFATSLPIAIIAGVGLTQIYNLIKKYHKKVALIVVLGILIFGAYGQITYANNLIKYKEGSYLQMKQAFEWIKSTTPEDSILLGYGIGPYSLYYAERINYDENLLLNDSETVKFIDDIDADYFVTHSFTPQPAFLGDYFQTHTDKWQIVNVWFFDQNQQQPAVIVYRNTETS